MLPTATTIERAAGCAASTAKRFELPLRDACGRFLIDTPKRLAAFLAQVGHESASLERTVENLNYSALALMRTWPNRFNQAQAEQFARKPEAIANRVYGGRMGNGGEATGDGWRYRGRGLIQITGKANYEAITEVMASYGPPDFVLQPELLESPQWAAMSAGAFWDDHELNQLADKGDLDRMTRVINGGSNGLADRKARYARAMRVLS
jgi:putative chitinase